MIITTCDHYMKELSPIIGIRNPIQLIMNAVTAKQTNEGNRTLSALRCLVVMPAAGYLRRLFCGVMCIGDATFWFVTC